jgi:hypothetical protein
MLEGGKQGGVATSHLAALPVALQPVLLAAARADSKLKVNGGCVFATGFSDDAHLHGDPLDIVDVPPPPAIGAF